MTEQISHRNTLREVVLFLEDDLRRISALLAKEYLNKEELAEFKILIEKYWKVLEIILETFRYRKEIVYEVLREILDKNAEELEENSLERCKVCNSKLNFDEYGVARCVCETYYYRGVLDSGKFYYLYMKRYDYPRGKEDG